MKTSKLTWDNSFVDAEYIGIVIPIGGIVEESSVQGYSEHRSYVELKENAKLDVQIGVRVYVDDDQDMMDNAATVAFNTYAELRRKFSAGISGVPDR